MLSDAEKEAIDHIKNYPINWLIENVNESAIKIVLNLIKKQSKEIEELRKKNEPQSDCEETVERTEEMVNMMWVNYNYISKDKIKELREIDNIDLIQFKIKELLGE